MRDPVTLCLFATQPKPSDSEDKQIAFHAILVCLLRSSLSLLLSTAPRWKGAVWQNRTAPLFFPQNLPESAALV